VPHQRLSLSLGYDVVLAEDFGGLAGELQACLPGSTRALVVTHPRIRALHGAALAAELHGVGIEWLEVPEGEAHKSLDTWRALVARLLESRPDRQVPVVAFGGGVVGDLAGFAASTVLRGLPFVQVPTTVLAAVDASVGGKTGVNVPQGKNLVGAFYQPRLVWAPLATLDTLPVEERRCGLGEIVKHCIIAGGSALARLEADAPALLAGEKAAFAAAIADSVAVKAAIVERDPLERGERALLNLGHTLGHAVESVLGYGAVRHGEAVAIGIVAVARLGVARGWTSPRVASRVEALVARLGLPTRVPPGTSAGALHEAMGFDKKRARGMVRLVVFSEPGEVRLESVPEGELGALAELGVSA